MLSQNVDIKVIKAIDGLANSSDIDTLNSQITAFEFEFIFDTTHKEFTEEFNYTDGNLIQKNYYTDSTKTTKIWQIDYIYDNGNLKYKDIKLILSGLTLRISYTWSGDEKTLGGNLEQKDRSWHN